MSKKNEHRPLERVPSLKKQTMQFCEDLVSSPQCKSPKSIRSPEKRQKNTPKAVSEKKKKKITKEEEEVKIVHDPHRKLVAQELLDTERTYVNQLGVLINTFKTPLENSNKLSSKEIRMLFSNVEEILIVHTELLSKVSTSLEQEDFMLGRTFVQLVQHLLIYITYCCNFTAANKFLTELKQGKYDLQNFFKEQQTKAGFDIQDLLILPVQRIPRYRLLLASLIAHTHEKCDDYPILEEALKKIELMAEKINKSIQELHQRQQAIDFSTRIRGKLTIVEDFLQPNRLFVSSHPLTILDAAVGEKKEKKIECHVFTDICVFTSAKGNEIEWLNHAYLHQSKLKKSFGEEASPLIFHYVNPDNCFIFKCDTEEQRESFTSAIISTLHELLKNKPNLETERKLIKLSKNEELCVWEAIQMPPRFSDRITVEELERESEIETKKALDELMDFYSTVTTDSPAPKPSTPLSACKRAGSAFRHQISTLSPLKQKKNHKKVIQIFSEAEVNNSNQNTPVNKKTKRSVFSNIENETNSPLAVRRESPLRSRTITLGKSTHDIPTSPVSENKRKRSDDSDVLYKKQKLFESPVSNNNNSKAFVCSPTSDALRKST